MFRENAGVRVAELLEERRRAFDVREERLGTKFRRAEY